MPGLHVQVANDLEILADHLGEVLRLAPLPPELAETVLVPSDPMRRWVRLALTRRLGVCAGAEFHLPGGFWGTLAQRAGLVGAGAAFVGDALTWRVYADLAQLGDDPALAPLRRYLADGDAAKRWALSTRIAGQVDLLQRSRGDWLEAWSAGRAAGPVTDDPHAAWLADRWRRLVASTTQVDQATAQQVLLRRLRSGAVIDDLPPRLLWIAPGESPPIVLDLVQALAERIHVHLWLWSPIPDPIVVRADDAGHPLLHRLGRQGRRWWHELASREAIANAWSVAAWHRPTTASALHVVQTDVADQVDLATRTPRPVLAEDDASLRLHRCHGRRRELEVLHEQLAEAFATMPGLTPGEVAVLMPDPAAYAALLPAVLDRPLPDGRRLPWRLADRSLAQADPLASALVEFLRLAEGRWRRSAVLDLLASAPVRAATGLGEAQLQAAAALLDRAGLRWGLDGDHRRQQAEVSAHADSDPDFTATATATAHAHAQDAGTLRGALDRLLLGVFTGPHDQPIDGTVPVAGDLAGDDDLLARLGIWLDQARALAAPIAGTRTVSAWCGLLRTIVDRLLTGDGADAADPASVRQLIRGLGECAAFVPDLSVPVAVVRAWLEERLDDAARPGDAVGGTIIVAPIRARRWIPARFIAVLGLDDASHPRRAQAPAFDLVARDPAPRSGDRLVRDDDRQLFLDLLLTARDRLHLSWPGVDPVSGTVQEPSICLGELLDTAVRTFAGEPAVIRRQLVVEHRLSPFDPIAGRGGEPPGSYDRISVRVASALASAAPSARNEPPFLDAPTAGAVTPPDAEISTGDWSLDDLIRTLANPSRAWLRHGLGLHLPDAVEEPADHEPFALAGLDGWWLTEAAVRGALGQGPGCPPARAVADGRLPAGALGLHHLRDLERDVDGLLERIGPQPGGPLRPLSVQGPGGSVGGRVPPPAEQGLTRWRAGRFRVRDRLALWCTAVWWNAWCDQQPGAITRSVRFVASDAVESLGAVGNAAARLGELIALAEQIRCEPLPLFANASWQAAEVLQRGGEPDEAIDRARKALVGQGETDPDADLGDAGVALLLRGRAPEQVLDQRFLDCAGRLWGWYLEQRPAAPAKGKRR